MDPTSIKLEDSWKSLLIQEFSEPYMVELREYLKGQILDRKTIYPKGPDYFAALNYTPYDKVSVVILGQDPYHGPGQAHGLSFSVPTDVRPPPSLINIYKELHDDLEIPPSTHGHLRHWAEQGVLLLNSVLTVEAMKPASHRGRGWEKFTDKIIEKVNEKEEPVAISNCIDILTWGQPSLPSWCPGRC